jgi:hypothetical protein
VLSEQLSILLSAIMYDSVEVKRVAGEPP